jgi:hypothetical protein
MARTFFIGREALLRRWRSLYQEFKKKPATPVMLVQVIGPEGVGRSALLDLFKKDLDKGDYFWELSCKEGPILPQLRQVIRAQNKNLSEAWIQRLRKMGPRHRAAIMLRDLQELEE